MNFIEELKKEVENYYTMEELLEEHYEEEGYKDISFVEALSTDEHRWYVLEENVYKIKIDNKDCYFGIREVGIIKSEDMTAEDVGVTMEMFEVEKIIKETFKKTNL